MILSQPYGQKRDRGGELKRTFGGGRAHAHAQGRDHVLDNHGTARVLYGLVLHSRMAKCTRSFPCHFQSHHPLVLFFVRVRLFDTSFFFLAELCILCDLSSPTREWTWALGSEIRVLTTGPSGNCMCGTLHSVQRSYFFLLLASTLH